MWCFNFHLGRNVGLEETYPQKCCAWVQSKTVQQLTAWHKIEGTPSPALPCKLWFGGHHLQSQSMGVDRENCSTKIMEVHSSPAASSVVTMTLVRHIPKSLSERLALSPEE